MKTTIEIKVRGYHTDQFRHVNNARYLEFLEEGRWDYAEKNNHFEMFHPKGIGHVTVNININYRKGAVSGQVLKIETDLFKKSRKSVTMKQVVFLKETDTLIADAEVTNVYLNAKSGEVIPVDDELIRIWPELASINDQE